MKSFWKKLWKVLKWGALVLAVCYMTFGGGLKDMTLGRYHRKAHAVFSDVHGVTEARIYLLMGTEEQRTAKTFPGRPYGDNEPIYGEVALTGEQLKEFLDHWRWQTPIYGAQALCHHPAYGFRLYKGRSLAAETGVCWDCFNYDVNIWPFVSAWYGFDSESEQAKELLNFCDQLLPYKRSETDKGKEPSESASL